MAKVLGEAKVNILAFLSTTSGAEGSVQVVVDNADRAKKALESAGLSCSEADVLQVDLPNVPGALGQFAGRLAARDVNITTAYQTTVKDSKRANVVLAVSDLDNATPVR